MNINIAPTNDPYTLTRLNQSIQTWHHENYPKQFKPFNLDEVIRAFEILLKKKGCFALIAKDDDTEVGYILGLIQHREESAFQYESDVIYIDQLSVAENFRGNGIGKILLNEVFKIAKKNKIKNIELDHWSLNKNAELFFTNNGFKYFNHRMHNIIK